MGNSGPAFILHPAPYPVPLTPSVGMIRSRAPMRVDLAGGWTDVPAYASKSGGAVVNVAISLYAHASVSRGGRGVSLRALDLGTALSAQRIQDLRADGE